VYYPRAVFRCAFLLWAKGLNAKDIHREMFPVYGGNCFSGKALMINVSLMTMRLKWRCCDKQKTSMLRVSKHLQSDGTQSIDVGGGYVEK
jgi:hypothetical protein